MDDPASKSLRDKLDALLRRAREISAEIEKRVEEVTAEPSTPGAERPQAAEPVSPPAASHAGAQMTPEKREKAQEAMEVAAEAVAVSAEAAAVTAEALSTIAHENGTAPQVAPAPAGAPTTVVPEAAAAVAQDASTATPADGAKKDASVVAGEPKAPPDAKPDREP